MGCGMPRLSRQSRKPRGNDVAEGEEPCDRYPRAVLEPHESLPVLASYLTRWSLAPAFSCPYTTKLLGVAASYNSSLASACNGRAASPRAGEGGDDADVLPYAPRSPS